MCTNKTKMCVVLGNNNVNSLSSIRSSQSALIVCSSWDTWKLQQGIQLAFLTEGSLYPVGYNVNLINMWNKTAINVLVCRHLWLLLKPHVSQYTDEHWCHNRLGYDPKFWLEGLLWVITLLYLGNLREDLHHSFTEKEKNLNGSQWHSRAMCN